MKEKASVNAGTVRVPSMYDVVSAIILEIKVFYQILVEYSTRENSFKIFLQKLDS